MPKIIVTSRYIKNASGTGVGKLVRYMGTREGVEKLKLTDQTSSATKKQNNLIHALTSESPETYEYLEFSSYLEKKTKAAASEFIEAWVERNADKVDGLKKLVSYMAERPGVEKLGKHGLFSQEDEPIDLDSTADEIANHPGIIWTHVISLHREDAERLNYSTAEAWKSLVRRNMIAIAEAHKIDVTNLKWVAAFQNTTNHPHCHLMVYAADAKQGYLTNKGIESIRRTMGQDIFRQEMYHLFKLETHLRDELKLRAKKTLQEYIERSREIRPANETMQQLFEKLISQFRTYQGKKVYGYYEKEKPVTPLEDNKEFRSIKNTIIQAAENIMDSMNSQIISAEKIHSVEKSLRSQSFKIDSAVCSLIQSLGRMFQSSCQQKWDNLGGQVDSKLASKIAQKKLAHGLRLSSGHQLGLEEDEHYRQTM